MTELAHPMAGNGQREGPGRRVETRSSGRQGEGERMGRSDSRMYRTCDLCVEVEVRLLAVAGFTQGQRGGRK